MAKSKKPLAQCDPDELWEPAAKRLSLTVSELRAQIALADSIIEEIINQEIFQNKSRQWFKSHP